MARRARIIPIADENPAEEGRSADQGESTETADNGSAEAQASSFSVVDKRGDDYVPPADGPLGSIEIIEAPAKRGRPRGTTRVPKATANEIAQAAPLLVGLSNQVVVTWMGENCSMSETEAKFLTPSVARLLSRLPSGAAQQVSLYTDPFIILTALGLWAARIAKIKEFEAKQKYQATPFEAARSVGVSGTNLGEEVPPLEQTPLGTDQVRIDESRANGAASVIYQGRNPI